MIYYRSFTLIYALFDRGGTDFFNVVGEVGVVPHIPLSAESAGLRFVVVLAPFSAGLRFE